MNKNFEKFIIPESIRIATELQKTVAKITIKSFPKIDVPKFDLPILNIPKIDLPKIDISVLEKLKEISRIFDNLYNNPELQFAFISDLEILNLNSAEDFKESIMSDKEDKDIQKKEELLNRNLMSCLNRHGLGSLWLGANYAMDSDINQNPDKLRHCLISIRTIIEHLIDDKLAPKSKLVKEKMFEKEFKNYNLGKDKLENIRISRAKKIEFFTSKIQFGMLEEFTKNEIEYICTCYSILCSLHNPNIGISESQVRNLKLKTGITIWLLVYLLEIIEE